MNPCNSVMLFSSQLLGTGGGGLQAFPKLQWRQKCPEGLRQEAGVMGKAGEGGSPLRFLAG